MNHPVFGKMESLGQPFDDIAHKAASEDHTTADAPEREQGKRADSGVSTSPDAPPNETSAAGMTAFVAVLRRKHYIIGGQEWMWPAPNLHDEAADMIERLQAELAATKARADAMAELAIRYENDARRLDWVEDNYGLHREAEITYVVDGYLIEMTYDGNPTGRSYKGENLRAAIDSAIAKEQP